MCLAHSFNVGAFRYRIVVASHAMAGIRMAILPCVPLGTRLQYINRLALQIVYLLYHHPWPLLNKDVDLEEPTVAVPKQSGGGKAMGWSGGR